MPWRPIKLIPFLVVPAAIAGYIAAMGLTGWCPSCAMIVERVTGRGTAPGASLSFVAFDLEGNQVTVATRDGVPCLIDLWSTSCPPCIEQRRVLAQLAASEGKGVRIVSVAVDRDIGEVQKFVAAHPGTGEELIAGPESVGAILAGAGLDKVGGTALELPTLIVVDGQGRAGQARAGLQSLETLAAAVKAAR
jgi:thiol-disulfide isomerase/thioredoxin